MIEVAEIYLNALKRLAFQAQTLLDDIDNHPEDSPALLNSWTWLSVDALRRATISTQEIIQSTMEKGAGNELK